MNESPPIKDTAEAVPQGASPPAVIASEPRFWRRIREHKILQWALGYLGAALALAHGAELLGHTYHWPEIIGRVVVGMLVVGFPLALTLAWYHGHKGLKGVSQGELMITSILLVIAAGLLTALVRTPAEPVTQSREPPALASQAATPALSFTNALVQGSPPVPAASIAVVPFVNLTGDANKEYFSDGMAEELINLLAEVPGLKVPARTSSFAYKGRNVDIRRIAQDLGVATILEGSVRSAGERIRVTAQLVNAQTGYHVWSQNYDRQFGDIFKLQDELAAAIVQALRMNLNADAPAATARTSPTQDVEAYRLYLQARAFGNGTEQSFRQSLALYDQALARDPKFARALAGRAWLRASFVSFGYPLPNALEDAQRDAHAALALSPNQGYAHIALGLTNALRGDWRQAEASFRAAIAAEASDPDIRATYAITVLANVGRLRQWRSEATEAYHLAPADSLAVTVLAVANFTLGSDPETVKLVDLAIALGMSPSGFGGIYELTAARQGHYAKAADRVVEGLPTDVRSAGAAEAVRLFYAALADPTKKPAARQALASLEHNLESGYINRQYRQNYMIPFFTMLDALDPAYSAANHVLDEYVRSGIVGDIWGPLWLPEMRPFRKDPRFQAFVTRLGLIDYWKQYGPPDGCDLKEARLTCY
jgi:TolB-like protein